MEPIVDPMFFYCAMLCYRCGIVLIPLAVLSAVIGGLILAIAHDTDNSCTQSQKLWAKRKGSVCLLLSFACLFGALVVPSEQVLLRMLVARNVTPDNLKTLQGLTSDAKEGIKSDIVEIIQAVMEKKQEKQ